MTVKELSEELEIGTRQVERYKGYLDEAGINIKTIPENMVDTYSKISNILVG